MIPTHSQLVRNHLRRRAWSTLVRASGKREIEHKVCTGRCWECCGMHPVKSMSRALTRHLIVISAAIR
jgi:hypothetical protein